MLKTIIIIVLVIGVLVGGLLTLRNSARTGVPGEDVLRRARQRELDLQEQEKNAKDD
jgi:TRAP-type mannitol/chloroaromatic compound transport system permease large subunit